MPRVKEINNGAQRNDSATNIEQNEMKNSPLSSIQDGLKLLESDPKIEVLSELIKNNRNNPEILEDLRKQQREILQERQFGQTEVMFRMMNMWDDVFSDLDNRTRRIETLLSTMVSLLVEKEIGASDDQFHRWVKSDRLAKSTGGTV